MVNEKETTAEETPEVSPIERAEKAAAALKAENDRAEKLRADQLLSGTAGKRVEPEPAKEPTAKEYADAVMSGKIKAQ